MKRIFSSLNFNRNLAEKGFDNLTFKISKLRSMTFFILKLH